MARTPELMLVGPAAQFLGIGRNMLGRLNRAEIGPPRARKGLRIWYSRTALKGWLKSRAIYPSPDTRARVVCARGRSR
jgi:hypothetical protein